MSRLALSQPECQVASVTARRRTQGGRVDLAALDWLRSPTGAAVLAELATAGPIDDAAALRLGTRLRRDHPVELCAAALTQARLRERAVAKFGAAAGRMWFT